MGKTKSDCMGTIRAIKHVLRSKLLQYWAIQRSVSYLPSNIAFASLMSSLAHSSSLLSPEPPLCMQPARPRHTRVTALRRLLRWFHFRLAMFAPGMYGSWTFLDSGVLKRWTTSSGNPSESWLRRTILLTWPKPMSRSIGLVSLTLASHEVWPLMTPWQRRWLGSVSLLSSG